MIDILDKRNAEIGPQIPDFLKEDSDDSQNSDDKVNTPKDLEYWVNTGMGWLQEGADIYSQVTGDSLSGDTGVVDISDIDGADNSRDFSKYYIYIGIGVAVVVALLIASKLFAKKK